MQEKTGRQVAVVTGTVAMFDYNAELLRKSTSLLEEEGLDVHGWHVDVSNRGQVNAAIKEVREKLGPISIMVTNAGVAAHSPFLDITEQHWDRVLAINLSGTFHCIQSALPDMVAAKWGRIITISSQSAQSGAANRANYVASNGGVIALTKALAAEFAPLGITVNTIPPSIVDTPMAAAAAADGTFPPLDKIAAHVPVRRISTPDDIAAACVYLCSDGASFVTGQQINVNGGMYM
jgi:NAD(P)-dependent dehydrogenase (short-subunit alcohol dehydrogenase family)